MSVSLTRFLSYMLWHSLKSVSASENVVETACASGTIEGQYSLAAVVIESHSVLMLSGCRVRTT